MTLESVVLEIDTDVTGDRDPEHGVFELVGNLEVRQEVDARHTIGGRGQIVNNAVSENFDRLAQFSGFDADEALTRRAGYYLDLGVGVHSFSLNFKGWEGAQDSNGDPLQWGDPSYEPGTKPNATGENPVSQMHCLAQYLRAGAYDSRNPDLRLYYGEYNDGSYGDESGRYDDYIHCTLNKFTATRKPKDTIAFNGSIVLEEALDWSGAIDAVGRLDW